MARLHLALLLLFVAIFAVIVSAQDKPAADKPPSTTTGAPAPTSPTAGDTGGNGAEDPTDDNAIGTTDDDAGDTPGDDDVAVAGPIGSETSYANYPPPQQASGSVATAVFGFASVVVATFGSLFFF